MNPPIRTTIETATILNKGNNAVADLGYDVMQDAKRGSDLSDTEFRDKVYRLILLRAYLKNLVNPEDGEFKAYYLTSGNEKKFNILLDAVVQLSGAFSGPGIPLIRGRRNSLVFYPSASGPSSGGGGTGGPANPGGVTFQNLDVDSPGEVVDIWDAASSNFAFYVVNVRGSGPGEGSRLDIVTVNLRDSNTPVVTNYRGSDIGGTTVGVTYSAAINAGNIELTANVPTDNWSVQGVRISFQNISFQNTIGPLPTGGTIGQYLRKSSSTDFDAAFASILMSEVSGLTTALTNLGIDIANINIALGNYLLLSGGTMTGNIAMGNNKVTGLPAAGANGEAVPYEQIFTKVIVPIPAWNMDTTDNINVAHGVDGSKIRMAFVEIRADAAALPWYNLEKSNPITGIQDGSINVWDATGINISRRASGDYDLPTFSSILISRGNVVLFIEN